MKKVLFTLSVIFSTHLLASPELIEAAKNGRLSQVKSLIQAGSDVNFREDEHKTPLMWAAINGHIDVVKLLLDNQAEVDSVDGLGNTPLIRAAAAGHPKIVNLLLSYGAARGHSNQIAQTAISLAQVGAGNQQVQTGLSQSDKDAAKENFAMVAKLLMMGDASSGAAPYTEKDAVALNQILGRDHKGLMSNYQDALNKLPMLITTTVQDAGQPGGSRTMPKALTQMIISYLDTDDMLQMVVIHPDADNRLTITKLGAEAVAGVLKGAKKLFSGIPKLIK